MQFKNILAPSLESRAKGPIRYLIKNSGVNTSSAFENAQFFDLIGDFYLSDNTPDSSRFGHE